MASPVADAYSGPSGQLIAAGRYLSRLTGGITLADAVAGGDLGSNAAALSGGITLADAVASGTLAGLPTPAWLAGKPLNSWFQIAGTAGGGKVDQFSSFAVQRSNSRVWTGAAAGHGSGKSNGVHMIDLEADAPAWVTRLANSAVTPDDVAYNPDGTPGARHTYYATAFIESVNRLMLFGCRFTYPGAGTFATMDGFNPATNTWDPAGTWANLMTAGSYGAGHDVLTDAIYDQSLNKFTPGANSWSTPAFSGSGSGYGLRHALIHDTRRNQLFCLRYGLGEGDGDYPTRHADIWNLNTLTRSAINFNASAALTAMDTEMTRATVPSSGPCYIGIDYDVANDRFLVFAGAGPTYAITPNNGTSYDVSVVVLAGGSLSPQVDIDRAVLGRFRYIPRLGGVVLQASTSASLYFMRTS